MSWLRKAHLEDFEDRNRVNRGIHRLQAFADVLGYAADLVYMTQRGARSLVNQVRYDKVLSVYPDVQDILDKADRTALDSPRKFEYFCKSAVSTLRTVIDDLVDKRSKFVNDVLPTKLKGLVDDE